MQKKTLLFTSWLILAATGTLYAKNEAYYVEAATTFGRAQPQNVLAIQPLSELVGKDTEPNVILGLGKNLYLHNGDRIAKVGLSYIGNPKMKEHSLNLDFKIFVTPWKFLGMTPYFGGVFGIGEQHRKGQSVSVSTDITTINYVSQPSYGAYYVPTTATFDKDPAFVRMGFELGESIRITDYADLFIAYSYESKFWQLQYHLAASPSIDNTMTKVQRINALRIGVNVNF